MKEYETVRTEVVAERKCTKHRCDLCKCESEVPRDESFVWGGCGRASGSLQWHYSIDGDYEPNERDLCYECAALLDDLFSQQGGAELPSLLAQLRDFPLGEKSTIIRKND